MIIFTRRRGVALLGLAGAALMAALAVAPAAQAAPETATHTFVPGLLLLNPWTGSLDDRPIGTYQATRACPTNNRAFGSVSLLREDGSVLGNAAPVFISTSELPSGTLSTSSLSDFVRAFNLTSGYYQIEVRCFNDDFASVVTADKNWIKIDLDKGTWRAAPLHEIFS